MKYRAVIIMKSSQFHPYVEYGSADEAQKVCEGVLYAVGRDAAEPSVYRLPGDLGFVLASQVAGAYVAQVEDGMQKVHEEITRIQLRILQKQAKDLEEGDSWRSQE